MESGHVDYTLHVRHLCYLTHDLSHLFYIKKIHVFTLELNTYIQKYNLKLSCTTPI